MKNLQSKPLYACTLISESKSLSVNATELEKIIIQKSCPQKRLQTHLMVFVSMFFSSCNDGVKQN